MSEPITPPPPPPSGGGPTGNPWEQRSQLGFVQALIDAVKLFITSPAEAFALTIRKGDYASPVLFAIIVSWVGVFFSQIWSLLFQGSMMGFLPPEMQEYGMMMGAGAGGLVMALILAPIWCLIGLFIGSAILHVCVLVTGAAAESDTGFEGTLRVTAYSSVAQLANILPMVGGIVGLVWTIILWVIGIQKIHRATQGKAIAAAIIPIILCCVCIGVFVAIMGAGLAAMFAAEGG